MGDWRSYDEIAERYDRVWSARFQAVARHIWALMPPRAGDRKLDIGTGTGIVPKALAEVAQAPGLMVGCDRSAGMLLQARAQVAGLRVLVGDATALPFESENFDLATASFVLSHVRDYHRALEETLWVLKPSGILAVTNWAPASDPTLPHGATVWPKRFQSRRRSERRPRWPRGRTTSRGREPWKQRWVAPASAPYARMPSLSSPT